MSAALQRAWEGRGALSTLLLPAAWVYGGLSGLRRALYRAGLLRTAHAGLPTIVVGNVVAGGAGKTPVVLALIEHLRARGLRPAVISRGYGREGSDVFHVEARSDPAAAGDEALLVRRRSGVPVVVGARRIEAANALRSAHPEVDVIVCDGFSGNIALKTIEGTARFVADLLKRAFSSSTRSKIGFLISRPATELLRTHLDPNNHNGAIFLGLNGIVVKSHGSANELGVDTAIGFAAKMLRDDLNRRIAEDLGNFEAKAA